MYIYLLPEIHHADMVTRVAFQARIKSRLFFSYHANEQSFPSTFETVLLGIRYISSNSILFSVWTVDTN